MNMKHFYIMMAMLAGCAGASAQTLGDGTLYKGSINATVPSKFTTDKRVKIVSYIEKNDFNAQINVYDDFKEVKSFNVTQPNTNSGYTITREREGVDAIIRRDSYRENMSSYYSSLDDFKNQHKGAFEIEISDGDSVVLMESTSFYLEYDKYGTKYPVRYFVYYPKTNVVYDVSNRYKKSTTYTGAWKESREERKYYFEGDVAIPTPFKDYDADILGPTMYATQTLFNNDSKYEYLRPKLEIVEERTYTYDRDNDGEIDKEETYYKPCATGFELVSEDGAILQSVPFDIAMPYMAPDDAKIFKMNGNYYVGFFTSYDNEEGKREYYTQIYSINPSTTSIQKVDVPQGLAVRPSLADRSTTISVETPAAQSDRRVIVTNAAGQTVWDTTIQAGQTNVQIDARHLSRGVNVVNVEGNSKQNNSCKVIVK